MAAALACVILLSSSACVEVFDATTLGTRTMLSARAVEQPNGEAFAVTKKAVFVLWGLAAPNKISLDRALAGQVTGDAEIANLRVVTKSGVGDIIVTIITLGLVVPRTVTYTGVIVQPAAAPAGAAP